MDVWFLFSRERSCFASSFWSSVELWDPRVAVQLSDHGAVPGTVLPVKPHPLGGLAGCSQGCHSLAVDLIWRGLGVCARHQLDFVTPATDVGLGACLCLRAEYCAGTFKPL